MGWGGQEGVPGRSRAVRGRWGDAMRMGRGARGTPPRWRGSAAHQGGGLSHVPACYQGLPASAAAGLAAKRWCTENARNRATRCCAKAAAGPVGAGT